MIREAQPKKGNPAKRAKPAASCGRGGQEGGEVKYSAHTPEQRRELARLAANHRWAAKKGD